MASSVLIQSAYDYIRDQITKGEFMPGTLLSENELSDALKMSRTPIRAAISRLEHEGLVASLKNRGLLVKEISVREVMEILEMLYVFQNRALDRIEQDGEVPEMKRLKALLNGQLAATAREDYHQYVEHSTKFMLSFIAVLNNMTVSQLLERYIGKLVLYATIDFKVTPHEPHYSANKVNQAIYDALQARDYKSIRGILEDSYAKGRERMMRSARI